MEKVDLRKQYKNLYAPSAKQVSLVDVPSFQFALIHGEIEPGKSPGTSPAFEEAIQALYAISYTLKFMSKKRGDNPFDYAVMPLEALWWVENGEFDITRPDRWHWTAMILQPDAVSPEIYAEALTQVSKKKPSPGLNRLRFERFDEGLCMQILHNGPYADEPATLEKMHAYAHQNGCLQYGKHHEIYLGDPLRTDPARLKTILRHPVRPVDG